MKNKKKMDFTSGSSYSGGDCAADDSLLLQRRIGGEAKTYESYVE